MTSGAGDAAIEGLGVFQGDEGKTGGHELEELLIQAAAFLLPDADDGFDALGPQCRHPPAGDDGIRIDGTDHHPGRLLPDQGLDAGGRPPLVGAGLQGDVEGGAGDGLPGPSDGVDLGVALAAADVIAFPDDPAVLDDDGADHGIRTRPAFTLPGQPQCPVHEMFVIFAHQLTIMMPVSGATKDENKRLLVNVSI